jgi:chromate reductase, NAD(P)H dehydrogenase (quinone)
MIVLLSGTNRPGSNTRKVTAAIEAIYQELGVPHRVLDLHDLPPELFSPDAYAAKPPAFTRFSQAILDASGVVIVTPEYNGSFPGVLKLFIDHLKFPESFEGRPVCFVGLAAGMWGALRSVEQIQAIFGYRNAHLFPQRVFMPGINNSIDAQGRFVNADLTVRLREQADGFVSFVEKLRGVRLRSA